MLLIPAELTAEKRPEASGMKGNDRSINDKFPQLSGRMYTLKTVHASLIPFLRNKKTIEIPGSPRGKLRKVLLAQIAGVILPESFTFRQDDPG